jgi:hypothetical protein
LLE